MISFAHEGLLSFQCRPRCSEKWRQVRRRTQVMVIPLPSPTTTAGAISRATLRAGPVFTRCGVIRRSFGMPNFSPHALPRVKTGYGAAASETSTDPSSAGVHQNHFAIFTRLDPQQRFITNGHAVTGCGDHLADFDPPAGRHQINLPAGADGVFGNLASRKCRRDQPSVGTDR